MYASPVRAAFDLVTNQVSSLSNGPTHFPLRDTLATGGTATVRVGAAWHLPRLLADLHVEAADVLAAAGLPPGLFDSPDNTLTYPELEQLLLACERYSGRDDFGLLVGQRSGLAELGLAGRAASCGDTVGDALRRLSQHLNLHDGAGTLGLVSVGRFTRVIYAIAEPGTSDTRHMQLGSVAIAFNVLQDLCGAAWLPKLVTVACRGPSNPRACQKFFRAPIHFNSDESALVFESHWLGQPLLPLDPIGRRRIERELAAEEQLLHANFPATVRRLLRKQLLLGDCSMDRIAATLGMHRRTLDRKLQRHGVRYGELVESVESEVARQLLRETGLQVQQVAESLHYSTAANFSTAFHRWTGMTPSEFRRQQH